MRLIFKIFSILLVLYVLLALFTPSVKAGCNFDSYGKCGGSCSCQCGGTCKCVLDGWGNCSEDGCNTCSTDPEDKPSDPQCDCGQYDGSCDKDSTPVCNCNTKKWECTGTGGGCSQWSSWSYCYPPPDCIQTRYCQSGDADPQARACCDYAGCNCSGGGGGPTATPFLRIVLFNPDLTPFIPPGVTYCPPTPTPSPYRTPTPTTLCPTPKGGGSGICPNISSTNPNPTNEQSPINNYRCNYSFSLCKAICRDKNPCSGYDELLCRFKVYLADFAGTDASQGGGLHDQNKLISVIGITPIQNGNVYLGNNYPDCRGASSLTNCYTWDTALSTGSRILYYIVITNTPTPTPAENWLKLKNTSFYTHRSLTQIIPKTPTAYDSDDDATPYFIIASPASDPGLVSAAYIHLGAASVSTKGWKTTNTQNTFLFNPIQSQRHH